MPKFQPFKTHKNQLAKYNTFQLSLFDHDFFVESQVSFDKIPPIVSSYLSHKDDFGREIHQFPVITFFGQNPTTGQSSSLHIWGFYPRFWIKVPPGLEGYCKNELWRAEFTKAIELAYQTCFGKLNKKGNKLNKGKKPKKSEFRPQLIHKITLDEKYDFYGYHSKKQLFLKIEIFDERKKKKIAKMLELGLVGFTCFQPFEVHISVYMHFYFLCNLHGFANIQTKSYATRYPKGTLPENYYKKVYLKRLFKQNLFGKRKQFISNELIDSEGKLTNMKLGYKGRLQKQTFCELEADCHYLDLINFKNISKDRRKSEKVPKISQRNSIFSQPRVTPASSQILNNGVKKFDLKVKWNLKITKVLENVWQDEKNRRGGHNMDDNIDWFIDLSPNLDRKLAITQGTPNPYYTSKLKEELDLLEFTNHINKDGSLNKLTTCLVELNKQSLVKSKQKWMDYCGNYTINVDRKKCYDYWRELQEEDK